MKQLYFLTTVFFLTTSLTAQEIDLVEDLEVPQGLVLNGSYLYFAEINEGSIYKININDEPPIPTVVVSGLDNPHELTFSGDYLYIAEVYEGTISKINITDANPTPVDVVSGLTRPIALAFKGNDLYIAELTGYKISKIDVTDTNPTPTDVVTDLERPNELVFNGDDLYFSQYYGNKVSKIDITDESPTPIDILTGIDNPSGLALNENNLYIADSGSSKISKIDISDVSPTAIEVLTIHNIRDILVENNILYTLTTSTISTLDINPLSSGEELYAESAKPRISPNPARTSIQVSELTTTTNYTIHTVLGTLLKSGNVSNNEEIDIRNLTNGIYFITFGNEYTLKFLKQ